MRAVSVLLLIMVTFVTAKVAAKGVYLTVPAFLEQSFGTTSPELHAHWLADQDKRRAKEIFNRDYAGLRVRYWRSGDRTAWIFDEIGKTQPITIGVLIAEHQIKNISILEFRESRGGEVRHPFFTSQFVGLSLRRQDSERDNRDNKVEVNSTAELDGTIDGITGATLSVRAVTRVAKFALYLSRQVERQGQAVLHDSTTSSR